MSCPQLSEKTLDIIEAVARLGSASMPQIQDKCRLPMTTTHRIMQSLLRRGFVMRAGRGKYQLGTSIIALAGGRSVHDLLAVAARAHLHSLSRRTRSHVHLGILEGGMVTYLIKQRYGKAQLHSAEGMQLEAYCSAIGKVLLSGLSQEDLARYVGDGAFVALTPNTITDPDRLYSEIEAVRTCGWAMDREEILTGLRCAAVPVSDREGRILAAISVSTLCVDEGQGEPQTFVPALRETAEAISRNLFPTP